MNLENDRQARIIKNEMNKKVGQCPVYKIRLTPNYDYDNNTEECSRCKRIFPISK